MPTITYSLGESAQQGSGWVAERARDFDTFIANVLNVHRRDEKDGPSFVPGTLSDGARNATAVDELSMLVLDVDKGQSLEHAQAILKSMDYNFFIHTSFNHKKSSSLFSWDKYRKWATAKNIVDLDNDEKIIEATIADGLIAANPRVRRDLEGKTVTEKEGKGVFIIIDHDPIDKFRVLFPLAVPFVMSEFGANSFDLRAGHEHWKKLYCFIGDKLGIAYDPVCADPARIYYRTAVHTSKERGLQFFRYQKHNGVDLDWRTFIVPADYVPPAKPRGIDINFISERDKTEPDLDILFEGGHFRNADDNNIRGKLLVNIIADVCSDLVVAPKADGGMRMICPMDDNHSKQGGDDAWLSPGEPGQNPVFSCSHTSCKGLKIPQFLTALTSANKLDIKELHKRMKWSDEAVTKDYVRDEREQKGDFVRAIHTPDLAPLATAVMKKLDAAKELHDPKVAPETLANFFSVSGPSHIITALGFSGNHKIDEMPFDLLVTEISKAHLPISEVIRFAETTKTLHEKALFVSRVKETRLQSFLKIVAEDMIVTTDLKRRQQMRSKYLQFFGCDEGILQDAIELAQLERSNFPEAERILIDWSKKLFLDRTGSTYYHLEDFEEITDMNASGLDNRFGHLTVPRGDKDSSLIKDLKPRLTTIGGIISDATKSYPLAQTGKKTYLNVYRPPVFQVEPKEGDAEPFLYHVREVFAGGNEDVAKRLLLFFADIVQNPSFKKSSAVVVLGGQGTGKSILFDYGFSPIFGQAMYVAGDQKAISGDYNEMRVNSLLCVFEEANMAGSRHKVSNVMKQLVTGAAEVASQKYQKDRKVHSITRYVLISNERAPIDLDPDDRRFFVIRTSDKHKADSAYHTRLREWFAKDGCNIMLHYLLNFDPYEQGFTAGWGALYEPPPMTKAKAAMLTATYTPVALLAEVLNSPGHAGGDAAALSSIADGLRHWPVLGEEMATMNVTHYNVVRKAIVMASDTHKTSKAEATNQIDQLCTGDDSLDTDLFENPDGSVEVRVRVFTQETIIKRLKTQNAINDMQMSYMLNMLKATKG